jgi:CRP-like cAMP-binding protein
MTVFTHRVAALSHRLIFSDRKMCRKRGIVVVASGATPRIDFMLRSHGASFSLDEEEAEKEKVYSALDESAIRSSYAIDRIILFMTVSEALEFCEATLIHQLHGKSAGIMRDFIGPQEQSLSSIFAFLLESGPEERETLRQFDECRYHNEIGYSAGEKLLSKEKRADGIYIVLKGAVASGTGRSDTVYRHKQQIVSGAGLVSKKGSKSNLMAMSLQQSSEPPVVATMWKTGGILGYTDTLLDRHNTFSAFATQNDTRVAKMTKNDLNLLQQEDPVLDALLHRVLLRASIMDLANCTCDDV